MSMRQSAVVVALRSSWDHLATRCFPWSRVPRSGGGRRSRLGELVARDDGRAGRWDSYRVRTCHWQLSFVDLSCCRDEGFVGFVDVDHVTCLDMNHCDRSMASVLAVSWASTVGPVVSRVSKDCSEQVNR